MAIYLCQYVSAILFTGWHTHTHPSPEHPTHTHKRAIYSVEKTLLMKRGTIHWDSCWRQKRPPVRKRWTVNMSCWLCNHVENLKKQKLPACLRNKNSLVQPLNWLCGADSSDRETVSTSNSMSKTYVAASYEWQRPVLWCVAMCNI